MKDYLFLTLSIFLILSLHGQRQLDIQGDPGSTDTVVTIKVIYSGEEDVIGLAVISEPTSDYGIGGYFFGGYRGVFGLSTLGRGVYGQSTSSTGVYGRSTSGIGVHGLSTSGRAVSGSSSSGYGVYGQSTSSTGVYGHSFTSYGVYGHSSDSTGGYFYGGDGIAIELGGSNSSYGGGNDDAVIRTQANQTDGDLIMVSNDIIDFHLDDDDNNSSSLMRVKDGDDAVIFSLDEHGNLILSGACSCSSDRNRKENIRPVDPAGILSKLVALPITEWQFRGEDIRHVGPMAQDFFAAFGLGQGETTIATVDADGVVLAGIQALYREDQKNKKKINEHQNEIDSQQSEINHLKKEITELKSLLIAQLEQSSK